MKIIRFDGKKEAIKNEIWLHPTGKTVLYCDKCKKQSTMMYDKELSFQYRYCYFFKCDSCNSILELNDDTTTKIFKN